MVTTRETRREARESLGIEGLNRLQREIFRVILRQETSATVWLPKGITCEELENHLGLKHQTVSARLSELSRAGLIEPGPEPGRTRSGRKAVRWIRKIVPQDKQESL